MSKGRTEAFSDAVIAIIITIMVLELKIPVEPTWHAFSERWPVFVSYALSFLTIGVFWGSHHRLLHGLQDVDGAIIWLNLHFLFWLSLVPFVTAWLGESLPAMTPTVAYGAVLFMVGVAISLLHRAVLARSGDATTKSAFRYYARKGMVTNGLYAGAVLLAAVGLVIPALVVFVVVALAWIIPESRLRLAGRGAAATPA